MILPVFPRNRREQRLLWSDVAGEPLISRQLRGMTNQKCTVITDQPEVCRLAGETGLDQRHMCPDSLGDNALLPPGTTASLKSLQQGGEINANSTVLVGDYRVFPLSGDVFRQAEDRFRQSGAEVLFSVSTRTKDHLCQLTQYYLVEGTDLLAIEERLPSLEEIVQSREKTKGLFFDEQGRLNLFRLSKGERYFDINLQAGLTQLPDNTPVTGIEGNRCLAAVQAPGKPGAPHDPQLYSLTDQAQFLQPAEPKYLFLEKQGAYLLFADEQCLAQTDMLRIWPGCGEKPAISEYQELYRLAAGNHSYIGPLCTIAIAPTPGALLIAHLKRTENDIGELVHLPQPREMLWEYDQKQGVAINHLTGRRINGRQDCVDLFSPSKRFIIFKFSCLEHLGEIVSQGRAEGLRHDPESFVLINSEFDLLRASVLHRTKTTDAADHRKAAV